MTKKVTTWIFAFWNFPPRIFFRSYADFTKHALLTNICICTVHEQLMNVWTVRVLSFTCFDQKIRSLSNTFSHKSMFSTICLSYGRKYGRFLTGSTKKETTLCSKNKETICRTAVLWKQWITSKKELLTNNKKFKGRG